METFTAALQGIGRGLRLPAGRRIGNTQVDRLDVLCFGKDGLERIIEDARKWSPDAPLAVRDSKDPDTTTVRLQVPLSIPATIRYRSLRLRPGNMSLSLPPEALGAISEMVVESIDLARLDERIEAGSTKVHFEREIFVSVAAQYVIAALPEYLSDEEHRVPVGTIVRDWLDWIVENPPGGATIDFSRGITFNPHEVGDEIARHLQSGVERQSAVYTDAGHDDAIGFAEYDLAIDVPLPSDGAQPERPSLEQVAVYGLTAPGSFAARVPYRGWSKSVHPVYTFDSSHEARVAAFLSAAPETVVLWARNEPRVFAIPTPLGGYHPDFLVVIRGPQGVDEIRLIEVKDDTRWEDPESDSRLKAAAASAWCAAQTSASGTPWSIGVARCSDVDAVSSWVALEPRLVRVVAADVRLPIAGQDATV
jgi:hypothetical protein